MTTPFDGLASSYAARWTDTPRGREQREAVWREIDGLFHAGDRVLDFGCGTGDDALHLAGLGVEVSGIDAASKMVEVARSRGVNASGRAIEDLTGPFSGALSNFGALNCVADLKPVADQLARLVQPGGPVALCVMGRFCLNDWRHAIPRALGRTQWRGMDVYYPTSSQIRKAFNPQFTFERRVAIGRGDHQLYIFRRNSGPAPQLSAEHPRRQFLETYAKIRAAEGRGSDDSGFYRALPFANSPQWRIRARTFEYFRKHILPVNPCDVLDLGAGNCWLSHRLAELGHAPVALDIFTDPRDGLRAARHYPVKFPVIESGFDDLPLPAARFDMAVFNSSIHYSSDYVRTLAEARRCLRPGGRVVILDSPVYKRKEHGEAMRAERQSSFERQYGFRSEALGSVEFFDLDMLKDLEQMLSLTWEIHRPWYGFDWHLRPVRALLKGRRPPSRFWILVGKFQ